MNSNQISSPSRASDVRCVLDDAPRRCLLPIPSDRKALWDFYYKQRGCGWEAGEIRYGKKDETDFRSLDENQRKFVETVLAFFAVGDSYVIDNLIGNFTGEVPAVEAQYNFGWQTQIEQVHAEAYAGRSTSTCRIRNERSSSLP